MDNWNYDVTNVKERGYCWVSIRASGGRTLINSDVLADGAWWRFAEQVYAYLPPGSPKPKSPAPLPATENADE